MVTGSGVLQVYNTFAPTPVELPEIPHAETFSRDWVVHVLSEVGGAILPYLAAGKLTGCAMKGLSQKIGATGLTSKFLTSNGPAMVLGAGAYDFTKAQRQGETRIGNALGSMAAFATFESGNALLKSGTQRLENSILRSATSGVGRFGIGAAGGLAGFETATQVSNLAGETNTTSRDQYWDAIASGGFLNVALPIVHHSLQSMVSAELKPLVTDSWRKAAQNNNQALPDLVLESSSPRRNGAPSDLSTQQSNVLPPEFSRAGTVLIVDGVGTNRSGASFSTDMASWGKGDLAPGQKSLVADARTTSADAPAALVERINSAAGEATPKVAENVSSVSDAVAAETKPTVKESPAAHPEAQQGKLVPLDRTTLGVGEPLGATVTAEGINFAIHSSGAKQIDLLLFSSPEATQPSQVLPLFRTGDVWHRFVPELPDGSLYLYRAHGPYQPTVDGSRFNANKALLDPYSKAITGDTRAHFEDHHALGYDNTNPQDPNRHHRPSEVDNVGNMSKSVAVKLGEFDWQGDKPPAIDMRDSVIYEVNLRGFTADADGMVPQLKGTYKGMIEKIPYLQKLGVTAVELLPIMEFDKADWPFMDPETGKPLANDWGYNTVGFQAPDSNLSSSGSRGQQITEFKTLVRELHKANIEVILDIVFNHTREGDHLGPTISFRGLDNNVYHLLLPGKPDLYVNHTGCGNTMRCNHPVMQKLILDTLRYWKQEMHVDGFRFDLASIFNYDINGVEKAKTPIIEAIETDPVLADVKLIAEAWSPANYRLGHFSDQRWAEWNGNFRDVARRFIKGDSGQVGTLADRVAGSPGWFDASKGRYSVNFITAHDGFTMRDLVSYNEKHNHRNGEGNRDGSNDNFSWNHGHEGPVEHAPIPEAMKAQIEQLRTQQTKNLLALMMMSRGTPMLLYGDEVRRTQQGNNNSWPVEQLNNMNWRAMPENADLLRFTQMLIELRKRQQIGRLPLDAITWHGTEPFKPDFGDHARFISWQYGAQTGRPPVYTAFNAYWEPLTVKLPPGQWRKLVDTSLPSGKDIVTPPDANPIGPEFTIQPRSSVILQDSR